MQKLCEKNKQETLLVKLDILKLLMLSSRKILHRFRMIISLKSAKFREKV